MADENSDVNVTPFIQWIGFNQPIMASLKLAEEYTLDNDPLEWIAWSIDPQYPNTPLIWGDFVQEPEEVASLETPTEGMEIDEPKTAKAVEVEAEVRETEKEDETMEGPAEAGSHKVSTKFLPDGRVEFTEEDGDVSTFANVAKYEKFCKTLGIEPERMPQRGEKRPSEERTQGEEESRDSKLQRQEQPTAVKVEETPEVTPKETPEVTPKPKAAETGPIESRAAASTDNPGQKERQKAKEDWEREPLTQGEINKMRSEHMNLVARNIVEATDLHPSYKGWE